MMVMMINAGCSSCLMMKESYSLMLIDERDETVNHHCSSCLTMMVNDVA